MNILRYYVPLPRYCERKNLRVKTNIKKRIDNTFTKISFYVITISRVIERQLSATPKEN
ncbi:hypothetical protein [Bacillus paranthracis]|uniref:hypothetical protein n=1 Tax=Bacillus paranthracis TaxID=2026186 RepID=UPI0029C2D06C|nr:hypothetical protein [Bacillus paranthracis]MDX6047345.1 hypothetical protein [Bacillus paranthracis]